MTPRRVPLVCALLLLAGCHRSQPGPDPCGIEKPDKGKATGVAALEELGAEITREESKPGKPVVKVALRGPGVTDATLKELQNALPRCEITR